MKLLVSGGRDWAKPENWRTGGPEIHTAKTLGEKTILYNILDLIHEGAFPPLVGPVELLIQGGAPGADATAACWASERQVAFLTVPAQWGLYGAAAGPRRNRRMLSKWQPDAVLLFPGGKGTADMKGAAMRAGVPTWMAEANGRTVPAVAPSPDEF